MSSLLKPVTNGGIAQLSVSMTFKSVKHYLTPSSSLASLQSLHPSLGYAHTHTRTRWHAQWAISRANTTSNTDWFASGSDLSALPSLTPHSCPHFSTVFLLLVHKTSHVKLLNHSRHSAGDAHKFWLVFSREDAAGRWTVWGLVVSSSDGGRD